MDRSLETLLYHYISVDTVSNVDCVGCSKLKQRPAGCKMPLKKTTFKKKMTIGKVGIVNWKLLWNDIVLLGRKTKSLPRYLNVYTHSNLMTFKDIINMWDSVKSNQFVLNNPRKLANLSMNDSIGYICHSI